MRDVKALTFDTGGTVLDWHSGISAVLAQAGQRHGIERDWHAITNDYRRTSLGRMTGQVAPSFNIDDVHRETLDQLATRHDFDMLTAADRDGIARAWHTLNAWPDFAPAMDRLRRRYPLVAFTILSVSLIIDVSRHNDLVWDCVVSCEMLKVYKPRPDAYVQAAKLLQLAPADILMVACHNFDLMAARAQGYRTAFVRRPDEWGQAGPPDPEPKPEIDLVVSGFAELADALE